MTTKRLFAFFPTAARIFALLLVFVLLAALAGCDDGGWKNSPPASSAPAESSPPEPEPEPEEGLPRPAKGIDPLTGLAASEGYTTTMRPVAVMVANDSRALPQRGLSKAGVIYEMETEGGITRMMALYTNVDSVPQVGPVRSTRDAFLQFALPGDAYLAHIGTSSYASNLLNHLSYQDLDGIYLGKTSYWFDYNRTTPRPGGRMKEYSFFTDAELLKAGIAQLELPTEGDARQLFLFADKELKPQSHSQQITLTFSGASSAGFIFNEETGLYTKTLFDKPQADEDGTALTFKNVLVLSCPVTLKPDGVCTDFDLRGGSGTWFAMGDAVPITWVKGGPEEPLRLYDLDGEELEVLPGKSYVGVISDEHGKVSYGRFEPDSSTTEAN